jgi:multiple antibiotic resistance protein
MVKEVIRYFVSLFVVVDPIFATFFLASLVESKDIRRVAGRASLVVFFSFLLTFFFGLSLLEILHISISSVKIFGGIVLLQMAFEMLQAKVPHMKHTEEEKTAAVEKFDVSFIPLAIPVLFGPGALTTTLIFRSEASSVIGKLNLVIAFSLLSIVVYIVLSSGEKLSSKIGITGINVFVRLMGLVVGALGSQFVVEGVKHLWTI